MKKYRNKSYNGNTSYYSYLNYNFKKIDKYNNEKSIFTYRPQKRTNKINCIFDKYINDNEDLYDCFNKICAGKDSINIFQAPTGGGKTFFIQDYSSKRTKDITILATNTTCLSEQCEASYENVINIKASNKKNFDVTKTGICYAEVYDQVEFSLCKIIEKASKDNEITVNLFIDEAHEIVNSSNYREAIINMQRAIIKCLENEFVTIHVFLTSATTRKLSKILSVDNLIICRRNHEEKKTNEFIIYDFDKKVSPYKSIISLINKSLLGNKKLLLFLNSHKLIERIKAYYESNFINDIACISSENKDSEEYVSLIQKSLLNKKITLATSLVNAGINILGTQVNDEVILGDDSIEVCYCVLKKEDCDIDSIEQFVARCRFNVSRISILSYMTNSKNEKMYKDYEEQINSLFDKVEREYFLLKEIKKDETDNINFYKINAYRIIDKKTCKINPFALVNTAYRLLDNQYFYHEEKFINEIEKVLKVKAQHEKLQLSDIKDIYASKKEELQIDALKGIYELKYWKNKRERKLILNELFDKAYSKKVSIRYKLVNTILKCDIYRELIAKMAYANIKDIEVLDIILNSKSNSEIERIIDEVYYTAFAKRYESEGKIESIKDLEVRVLIDTINKLKASKRIYIVSSIFAENENVNNTNNAIVIAASNYLKFTTCRRKSVSHSLLKKKTRDFFDIFKHLYTHENKNGKIYLSSLKLSTNIRIKIQKTKKKIADRFESIKIEMRDLYKAKIVKPVMNELKFARDFGVKICKTSNKEEEPKIMKQIESNSIKFNKEYIEAVIRAYKSGDKLPDFLAFT